MSKQILCAWNYPLTDTSACKYFYLFIYFFLLSLNITCHSGQYGRKKGTKQVVAHKYFAIGWENCMIIIDYVMSIGINYFKSIEKKVTVFWDIRNVPESCIWFELKE